MTRSLRNAALAALGLLLGASSLDAQIPGLRDAASRLGSRLPDVSGLLQGKQPITTSLDDAKFAVDSLDNFRPSTVGTFRNGAVLRAFPVDSLDNFISRLGRRGVQVGTMERFAVDSLDNFITRLERRGFAVDSLDNFRLGTVLSAYGVDPREGVKLRSMLELQRTPGGGFVLQPGYYELHNQSYCLKAGTHGPGGGNGYLYAAPDGPAGDAIVSILRNSVQHPDIEQRDIQTLLWAIIARAKFEDLSAQHKATASRLLTPRQIATLNRSALDLVPGPALDRAMASMPPLVRQVVEAEARLRQMLVNPATSFAELERVAVLAGAVGMGPGSREVPEGRWSRHPDGYYVRYLPQGYSYTVMQVWVPQGSAAVGKELDPATHIAVPGNTARQRLIQSGRPQQRS
ncbi:MAG TPA: hypothetical protein VHG51_18665 [Longimicrobiaceae bacterium]|nr:hypothetical protein [Longimicrobiaceae bacterium]